MYHLIDGQLYSSDFSNILGQNMARGLLGYVKYFDSDNEDLDLSAVLLDTLDSEMFDNREFIEFLVLKCLRDDEVKDIYEKNAKVESLSVQAKRQAIIRMSKSKVRKSFCDYFGLPLEYFRNVRSNSIIVSEVISPYTPLTSEDLIGKHFLRLHDYQKRVKDDVVHALLSSAASNKLMIQMPTGSGKTTTCIEAIIDFMRTEVRRYEEGCSLIWFAHSNELCQQAYETLLGLWKLKGDGDINVHRIFGASSFSDFEMVNRKSINFFFVGFQKFYSLQRNRTRENIQLLSYLTDYTRLCVVDEAHKALAPAYQVSIERVIQRPDCRLIGLSATPGRSNYLSGTVSNSELSLFFNGKLIRISDENGTEVKDPMAYLQKKEVLAHIDQEELPYEFNLVNSGYSAEMLSDIYNKGSLGKKEYDYFASDPLRNNVILEVILSCYKRNDLTLVFAVNTDHCKILAVLLRRLGIEVGVILAETDKALRNELIERFKRGDLKILINYGVLSTGFDAPRLNSLVITRPTNSVVLYSQMVGRALRGPKNGGNERNKLYTIKDNLIGFPSTTFMYDYWEDFWN